MKLHLDAGSPQARRLFRPVREGAASSRRLAMACGVALLGSGLFAAAALPPDVVDALKALQTYETGASLKPVKTVERHAIRVMHDPAARRELAAALAAALADPTTKPDAVVFLCREIGRVGGAAEVSVLARLLGHERHADAARLALEMIPDPAAGKALLDALSGLTGASRIGAIRSLAARREAAAVSALARLARDADTATASAAIRALGAVGTPDAAKALADQSGPAARAAKLECAARLAAAGDRAAAWSLARSLVSSDGTPADRVAALSALAAIDAAAAAPELVTATGDADDFVATSAIGILSHAADATAALAMAEKLNALPPPRKARMLDALAIRGVNSVLPVVRPMLRDSESQVREAAARVLGAVGTAEDVEPLAIAAADGNRAAAAALALIRDPGADAAIVAAVGRADVNVRVVLMEAATARRSAGAPGLLAGQLGAAEPVVRLAAARGLASIGTPAEVPALISALTGSGDAAVREVELALIGIGRRESANGRTAAAVTAKLVLPGQSPEVSTSLLRVLAGLGGREALAAVRTQIASGADAVRDAAVRALAGWTDAEALPDLLALAKDAASPVHRALALRGALRLAPSSPAPIEWLEKAAPLANDVESRRALCAALTQTSGAAALRMAVTLAKVTDVADEAALAAVAIAKKLIRQDAPAVEAAMTELLALSPGSAAEAQARALLREAKGQTAATAMSAEKRAERVAAIAKAVPAGQTVAAYLDCGPETESPEAAQRLKVGGGARAHTWAGAAAAADMPSATVAFSEAAITLHVLGLDAQRRYRLVLAWWDYDGNGRRQSVWCMRDCVVPPTDLPSGRAGAGPARVEVALPGAGGDVSIVIRREGSGNVVLGEAWLIDAGPTAPPMPRAADVGPRNRVLLATGFEYPGHKWMITAPLLRDAIAADPRLAVEVSEDPAAWGAADLRSLDAIVLHYVNWQSPGPGAAAQENLRAAVSNGTGLVLVHFACGAFQGWPEFARMAGRVWNPRLRGHDPRGPFRVVVADRGHPITAGVEDFDTDDELYTCLDGDTPIRVLATATSKVDGRVYPMAFVLEYGKGRVFHCVLGHDAKAFESPAVGALYRRGTAWASGLTP